MRNYRTGLRILAVCLLWGTCKAGTAAEILVSRFNKGTPVIQIGTNDFYQTKGIMSYLERNTPEVQPDSPKQWRKFYDAVSKELVHNAEKSGLDARSLEKLLKMLPKADENKGLAVVPVAVHQTQEKGELVWVITLRWEEESAVLKGDSMAHIRYFSFLQKSLKQTGFVTCM